MFYGSRKRFVVVEGYRDRARRVLLKMAGRNHTSRCPETQPGCGGSCFLKENHLCKATRTWSTSSNLGRSPICFKDGANPAGEQEPLSGVWDSGGLGWAAGSSRALLPRGSLETANPWKQRFTAPLLVSQSNPLLEGLQKCFKQIIWGFSNSKVFSFYFPCSNFLNVTSITHF